MFITPQVKARPQVNEQRYCGECAYIGKNGYCSRVNMFATKEKQVKEWIRTVNCLINNFRENGAGQ